jgi:hypothetical protein
MWYGTLRSRRTIRRRTRAAPVAVPDDASAITGFQRPVSDRSRRAPDAIGMDDGTPRQAAGKTLPRANT